MNFYWRWWWCWWWWRRLWRCQSSSSSSLSSNVFHCNDQLTNYMADKFDFSWNARSHNPAHWILSHQPNPFFDFSVSFEQRKEKRKRKQKRKQMTKMKNRQWKSGLFQWIDLEKNKSMASILASIGFRENFFFCLYVKVPIRLPMQLEKEKVNIQACDIFERAFVQNTGVQLGFVFLFKIFYTSSSICN